MIGCNRHYGCHYHYFFSEVYGTYIEQLNYWMVLLTTGNLVRNAILSSAASILYMSSSYLATDGSVQLIADMLCQSYYLGHCSLVAKSV